MNKNKNKGKVYEREIAEIFSKIFGGSWIRVPNSGAFTGGQNVIRLNKLSNNQAILMSGDIIPPDEFKITIECKARKDFKFHQLFQKNGSKTLNEWIDQANIDFNQNKNLKLFIVVFKPNRCGNFICIDLNFNLKSIENRLYYKYNDKTYLICELIPFLTINKESIKILCK